MAGQAKMPIGIKWDNAAYAAGLKRRVEHLKNVSEQDAKAACVQFINHAKEFAPVKTGFMRSNIYMVKGSDERGPFFGIYCRAAYWLFVEFGTIHQAAQAFFRPALILARQYLIARVKGKQ